MTRAEIARMHVRCAAPLECEREALALRSRLEQTARTHLPGALEPVLAARKERVFAEQVAVRLDFDPSDYDDVTLATLWAGRVDAALVGEHTEGGTARGVRRFASDREFDTAALEEAAATGSLSWIFSEYGFAPGPVTVGDLLAALARTSATRAHAATALLAGDDRLARGLYARLAPREREETLAAFERALGARVVSHAASRREPAPGGWHQEQPAPPLDEPSPVVGDGPASEPYRVDGSEQFSRRQDVWTSFEAWREALAALARGDRLGELTTPAAAGSQVLETEQATRPPRIDESPTAIKPSPDVEATRLQSRSEPRPDEPTLPEVAGPEGWWSRVAGLAFLHPWLAEYLSDSLPGVTPLEGRIWALAVLAEPGDEALVLDPLVRLLAGDDLHHEPAGEPVPPDLLEAFARPAEELLASFAGTIPGFGESTPGFLRTHFLVRGGLLEPLNEESFRLVLEPAPLDPILELLPYPVESFRLPWSPTVSVRRRERDARL